MPVFGIVTLAGHKMTPMPKIKAFGDGSKTPLVYIISLRNWFMQKFFIIFLMVLV
jgi:hypothetical protein